MKIIRITRKQIEFTYHGDEILMQWPWVKPRWPHRYISVLASGNGDFGDAGFNSLREIREFWKEYERACLDSQRKN